MTEQADPIEEFPTFIAVQHLGGQWLAALIRFRKDGWGREYKEIGVLPVKEEKDAFEIAKNYESGSEDGFSHSLYHVDPDTQKLYPVPKWFRPLHPRWNKLDN